MTAEPRTESDWIADLRRLSGESSITVWADVFAAAPADAPRLKILFEVRGRRPLIFRIPVPSRIDDETRTLVARYLAAFISNRVVTRSALGVVIATRDLTLVEEVNRYFDGLYGYGPDRVSLRELMRQYHGSMTRIRIRSVAQEQTETIVCAINIGQTMTRMGIVLLPDLAGSPRVLATRELHTTVTGDGQVGRFLQRIGELSLELARQH